MDKEFQQLRQSIEDIKSELIAESNRETSDFNFLLELIQEKFSCECKNTQNTSSASSDNADDLITAYKNLGTTLEAAVKDNPETAPYTPDVISDEMQNIYNAYPHLIPFMTQQTQGSQDVPIKQLPPLETENTPTPVKHAPNPQNNKTIPKQKQPKAYISQTPKSPTPLQEKENKSASPTPINLPSEPTPTPKPTEIASLQKTQNAHKELPTKPQQYTKKTTATPALKTAQTHTNTPLTKHKTSHKKNPKGKNTKLPPKQPIPCDTTTKKNEKSYEKDVFDGLYTIPENMDPLHYHENIDDLPPEKEKVRSLIVTELRKAGYKDFVIAGFLSAIQHESDFNIHALGQDKVSYGLCQWQSPRKRDFKKLFGHDITQSTAEEQVKFIIYELKGKKAENGQKSFKASESTAEKQIKRAKNAYEAGYIIRSTYERPKDPGDSYDTGMTAINYENVMAVDPNFIKTDARQNLGIEFITLKNIHNMIRKYFQTHPMAYNIFQIEKNPSNFPFSIETRGALHHRRSTSPPIDHCFSSSSYR